MTLTVADIGRWSAEAVRDVFHAGNARGQATLEASRQLSSLAVFDAWEGATAEARKHANASIRQDLDAHGNEALAVARAAGKAADDIEHVQSELRTLLADANGLHMTIDQLANKVIPSSTFNGPPMEAVIAEMQLQPRLDKVLAEANAVDAELAAAINMAEGNAPIQLDPSGREVDGHPGGDTYPGSDRGRNEEEAFKKVYGRDPVSANDWRMAAALDPHSYLPKDHEVPPQIVAGRFTPQPGKGVVRTNLFIPADQVMNTAKDGEDLADGRLMPRNFGDNRGPSATADPEASRVSMFVDYEHGVIVVRQNPTATVDGQRGGAASAVPNVHVVQAPDGRMTIDYNAHDSYEMPLATDSRMTVNGRITLSPQADGTVALGGNATVYPSMESYQYREGLPAAQLQWNPASTGGEWGPATSLMRHHWVGDATIPPVRPDMPGWKWELENAMPYNALPFFDDPFVSHTTQLINPFQGGIPTVGTGR